MKNVGIGLLAGIIGFGIMAFPGYFLFGYGPAADKKAMINLILTAVERGHLFRYSRSLWPLYEWFLKSDDEVLSEFIEAESG